MLDMAKRIYILEKEIWGNYLKSTRKKMLEYIKHQESEDMRRWSIYLLGVSVRKNKENGGDIEQLRIFFSINKTTTMNPKSQEAQQSSWQNK